VKQRNTSTLLLDLHPRLLVVVALAAAVRWSSVAYLLFKSSLVSYLSIDKKCPVDDYNKNNATLMVILL